MGKARLFVPASRLDRRPERSLCRDMRILLLLGMLACLPALAHGQAEVGPETVAARFVAAWNAHDAEGFGRLLATDADWVTAGGLRLQGRANVRSFLGNEHATWAKHTGMRAVSVHVRPLSTGSASVFLEWEIFAEAGVPGSPPRRGNNLFVAVRGESGWVIVAGQVALAPVPR